MKVNQEKLSILLTIDTEVMPRCPNWRAEGLSRDLARDIYGATSKGRFGIKYQADLLKQKGLKGVFFVEALFACETGIKPLTDIVNVIQSTGHEVQLHIHTEWLSYLSNKVLNHTKVIANLKDLSLSEQQKLIEIGKQNLIDAGAINVTAFRAGNYGANFDTLKALSNCGLRFDSSYNYPYLRSDCGIELDNDILIQPRILSNITEIPVNFFRDFPGHVRHTQLCALSSNEMKNAIKLAYEKSWFSFVIVSHSFELLTNRKNPFAFPDPDWAVIKRFDELCEFLSDNTSNYQTIGFNDLAPVPKLLSNESLYPSLVPTLIRTINRLAAQIIRRIVKLA